jgi:hypothetical protein
VATALSAERSHGCGRLAELDALSPTALLSIALLLLALTVDVWIYSDARRRQQSGQVPTVSIGSFRIETPEAWFFGCLLLWVIFVPLYLTATDRNPFAHSDG